MTGILIIALGKTDYGMYAYNLALSIKKSADIPIALITDMKAIAGLRPEHQKIFDKLIIPKEEHYTENGLNAFKLKTYIYDYTPFENTLFLDADTLFLNRLHKITDLLKELENSDFQIYEVAKYSKENAHTCDMVWLKLDNKQTLPKVWDVYKLDDDALYPEYNSSFVWFKKTPANRKYFEQVKKNYFDRKLEYRKIGKDFPDELAYNLASAQLKHYGTNKYRPIYFHWMGGKNMEDELQRHWFMGLAGGFIKGKFINMYRRLSKRDHSIYWRINIKNKAFFNKKK